MSSLENVYSRTRKFSLKSDLVLLNDYRFTVSICVVSFVWIAVSSKALNSDCVHDWLITRCHPSKMHNKMSSLENVYSRTRKFSLKSDLVLLNDSRFIVSIRVVSFAWIAVSSKALNSDCVLDWLITRCHP